MYFFFPYCQEAKTGKEGSGRDEEKLTKGKKDRDDKSGGGGGAGTGGSGSGGGGGTGGTKKGESYFFSILLFCCYICNHSSLSLHI